MSKIPRFLRVLPLALMALTLLACNSVGTDSPDGITQPSPTGVSSGLTLALSPVPDLVNPGELTVTFNIYDEKHDRTWGIRDPYINSDEDLEQFKIKYPDPSIQISPEPYFPYHSIWSLPPILSLLFSANQKPILRQSSDITPQFLNEYNIIFVGSIKTLYSLNVNFLPDLYLPIFAASSILFCIVSGGNSALTYLPLVILVLEVARFRILSAILSASFNLRCPSNIPSPSVLPLYNTSD